MPRNGSGTYALPTNSWNPATNGALAATADWQALINDVAAAVTASVAKDGQTVMTGSLDMGGFNLTNVASASIASLSLFPNVAAPVTASDTELNYVDGVTSAIQTQLDAKQPLDADLTALSALSGTGLLVRTGPQTYAERTLVEGSGVTITNPSGIAGDITIAVQAGVGTGDVLGAASSTTGNLVSFADTSGKVLADSGIDPDDLGDVSGPASSVDDRIATFDGLTGKLIQDGGQTIAEVITAAGASSGLVLLATQTASNSATLDFASGIDSTYDQYVFEGVGITPVSGSQFWLRVSTDGGSSYPSGASDYIYLLQASNIGSTGETPIASTGTTHIRMSSNSTNETASQGGLDFSLVLKRPAVAGVRKKFSINSVLPTNTGTSYEEASGVGLYIGSTDAINAVRFLQSSGNISTGVIRMYGVKK